MRTIGNTADGGEVKVSDVSEVIALQQVKRPDEKEGSEVHGGTLVYLSSGQTIHVANRVAEVEAALAA